MIRIALAAAILVSVGGLLLWQAPRIGSAIGARAGFGGPNAPRTTPPAVSGPARTVWGGDVRARVLLQQPVEQMPEPAPYTLRVTELEMEPRTRIFEHRQSSAGAHLVVRGSIQIEDLDAGTVSTYQAGQSYFEGIGPLHRAVNDGAETNRVLMFDLVSASRGFDGTQQFTSKGRHNEGELRSGPYAQVPLPNLPDGPLMLRVTELGFGPKAKTAEHARLGPTMFFVQEGTATIRKDWENSSMTFGTNGYFFEDGRAPFLLENKPPTPARFVSVEILPASLADGASTIPTGSSN